jgi:hypothetical protein
MGYLSGRDVVMWRDIAPPPSKSPPHWPQHLAALNIRWAVFPARLYKEGERHIRELMDRGVIVPSERVAQVGDLVLAKVTVIVPPAGKDWRKQPIREVAFNKKVTPAGTKRPSQAKIAKRHRQRAAAHRAAVARKQAAGAKLARQHKIERQRKQQLAAKHAAKQRKLRHERRKKSAATAPATQPSSRSYRLPQGLPSPRPWVSKVPASARTREWCTAWRPVRVSPSRRWSSADTSPRAMTAFYPP